MGKNTNMKRSKVYEAVDSERDYQDAKWGGKEHDKWHSHADWIIFVEILLNRAKICIYGESEEKITDIMRKVTALGIAYGEQFGFDKR